MLLGCDFVPFTNLINKYLVSKEMVHSMLMCCCLYKLFQSIFIDSIGHWWSDSIDVITEGHLDICFHQAMVLAMNMEHWMQFYGLFYDYFYNAHSILNEGKVKYTQTKPSCQRESASLNEWIRFDKFEKNNIMIQYNCSLYDTWSNVVEYIIFDRIHYRKSNRSKSK